MNEMYTIYVHFPCAEDYMDKAVQLEIQMPFVPRIHVTYLKSNTMKILNFIGIALVLVLTSCVSQKNMWRHKKGPHFVNTT